MKEWQNHLDDIEAKIPGHSGLTWNEEADRAAGLVVPLGMLQHMPNNIVTEVKHRLTQREREEQDGSWLVVRLKERGYKYGGGASVLVRGCEREVFNHTELGVIPKNMV